jgi:hypothetical protein
MPMHDWTKVEAWVYHDFHTIYLVMLRHELNAKLPAGYYAVAEQNLRTLGPDILALQTALPVPLEQPQPNIYTHDALETAGILVADRAKKIPGFRQKRLTIRHSSNNRVVAILELVSRGNKESKSGIQQFTRKICHALEEGIHAVIIDPFPPSRLDPNGIHAIIWSRLTARPSATKNLTCCAISYESLMGEDETYRSYIATFRPGDPLPDIPLFLNPGQAIILSLEAAYVKAYEEVLPQHREILERSEPV